MVKWQFWAARWQNCFDIKHECRKIAYSHYFKWNIFCHLEQCAIHREVIIIPAWNKMAPCDSIVASLYQKLTAISSNWLLKLRIQKATESSQQQREVAWSRKKNHKKFSTFFSQPNFNTFWTEFSAKNEHCTLWPNPDKSPLRKIKCYY